MKKFINPLLSTPYSWYTVDCKKTPFQYYPFHLLPNYNSNYQHFRDVKVPIKYKNYDPLSAAVPWRYCFRDDKRRAMRWLKTPEDMLTFYFRLIGVNPKPYIKLLDYPLSIVLPLFKKIKIFVHTHYDMLGLAGRYFVDFDTFSGIPPNYIRSGGDDPYKWLTELVPSQYSVQWWAEQFRETFAEAIQNLPSEFLTLEQFINSPWLWVTNGATKFSKLFLGDELVRTKLGAASSLTAGEKLTLAKRAVLGYDDQGITVFPKFDEASFKTRLIANVQLGGYWLAAYIRYLIEACVGDKPKFAKLMPSFYDKISLIELLRKGELVLPLDESAYDYHVTRESWLGFFVFLNETFPDNAGVKAFEQYFHSAHWIYDTKKDRWLKGMPSGLALTSILNSWMNYIKQRTIVPGVINWACGDDVLSVPYTTVTLDEVEKEYAKFGSEANASKNWSSYRFGEYLRVLYGPRGTTGYPARIFGTLLYAYDLSFRTPIDKLNENAALWKNFYDRLGLPMDENTVARDLSWSISNRVPGFSIQRAKEWLHSPRVLGGFGKLPYNNLAFTWQFEDKKVKNYTGNLIRLPPVIEQWGRCHLIVTEEQIQNDVSLFLGQPYSLPPITSEEEWVQRLNREDVPDKGPFTSLVLDPIPLPVVDFVSIANMSQIATTFSYNSYPNLHGSWRTINSRLVNLSLKLVEFVADYMDQHKIDMFV